MELWDSTHGKSSFLCFFFRVQLYRSFNCARNWVMYVLAEEIFNWQITAVRRCNDEITQRVESRMILQMKNVILMEWEIILRDHKKYFSWNDVSRVISYVCINKEKLVLVIPSFSILLEANIIPTALDK